MRGWREKRRREEVVEETSEGGGEGLLVRRGRVEVLEIGGRTRKGGYHLTLQRNKHFSQFSVAQIMEGQ